MTTRYGSRHRLAIVEVRSAWRSFRRRVDETVFGDVRRRRRGNARAAGVKPINGELVRLGRVPHLPQAPVAASGHRPGGCAALPSGALDSAASAPLAPDRFTLQARDRPSLSAHGRHAPIARNRSSRREQPSDDDATRRGGRLAIPKSPPPRPLPVPFWAATGKSVGRTADEGFDCRHGNIKGVALPRPRATRAARGDSPLRPATSPERFTNLRRCPPCLERGRRRRIHAHRARDGGARRSESGRVDHPVISGTNHDSALGDDRYRPPFENSETTLPSTSAATCGISAQRAGGRSRNLPQRTVLLPHPPGTLVSENRDRFRSAPAAIRRCCLPEVVDANERQPRAEANIPVMRLPWSFETISRSLACTRPETRVDPSRNLLPPVTRRAQRRHHYETTKLGASELPFVQNTT